ncbi:dihydrolipoyl dehydrogenase [Candidatus Nucleicultrix amoebiphila]|jgi:dihydrolipoamide dehydrogenase|uniref:Dihydrolipoyl dehydrogenase n=1 Tax=Candidatus Nucleicultrix amoebiphila FS5 TaxID=1414854 RepID=A0A1W6N2K6_9PROT|nr:dihydrolipoyl dehydrogenase [Candidatus Nucleicultrix amoebiphila]ARN84072.1 dihydrolipoamide dehydrogenase [Candidatus Nucleicultrix amoebiphila FS5]
MSKNYDLIIIGAGPGGYVAAIRAAQLGMKVACVDKRKTLGGVCLNVGCIPSKALLQSSQKWSEVNKLLDIHGIEISGAKLDLSKMMARKNKVVEDLTRGIQYLFKKNNIDFIQGLASFKSTSQVSVKNDSGNETVLNADKIIIASGSSPTLLPGIYLDEEKVVSSTGALSLNILPAKMAVIGGGYIGLEMASVWSRLGSEVTVIEFFDRIVPMMDNEVGQALLKSLRNQGINFKLSTKVTSVKKAKNGLTLTLESAQGGNIEELDADVLLSSAGRRANTEGLALEKIGVALEEAGRIKVDENFKTSVNGIYAIGDVIRGPMLAHKAEEEGVAVAEYLAGQKSHVNYAVIPAVIYTHPEVASVGKTEEELKKSSIAYKVGKFPFSANSRAKANSDVEGFVKVISHAVSDEVLGVHIIHSEAGTMIAEAAMAMEFKASSEDIARTCHAHPTHSEALKEAALSVLGRSIHI